MYIINVKDKNVITPFVINGDVAYTKTSEDEKLTGIVLPTTTNYEWHFGNGVVRAGTTLTNDYVYPNPGIYYPYVIVFDGLTQTTFSAGPVYINPIPSINFSGQTPSVNTELTFFDNNAGNYFENTISACYIDYGDGNPPVSGSPETIWTHTYATIGEFQVTLTYYDMSGNTSVDTFNLSIISNSLELYKLNYISLCGPESTREQSIRDINLVDFLPDYLKDSETYDFIEFFQNFLNEMYDGRDGISATSSNNLVDYTSFVSASAWSYLPTTNDMQSSSKISILEKIERLRDLHDIDNIDIKYIQFFARYLGYNMDLSRNEVGFGSFGSESSVCSASDNEKYLRFMVSQLPHWYKIKTTDDMIKILLYSFGLIGDIKTYWTKDYGENYKNWKLENDHLVNMPDNWYPTPHFSVVVDIDRSMANLFFNIQQAELVLKAIRLVRPANKVFRGLTAVTTEQANIYIGANSVLSTYILIEADGPSDGWNT